jgi:hypothetical protein
MSPTEEDDLRADETPDPVPPPEDEYAYYRPRPGRQVYLILGAIIFVVGVAVLLVYQTGDRKTILTKEALRPAVAPAPLLAPAAAPVAAAPDPWPGSGARNCPSGGGCPGAAGGGAPPCAGGGGCPGRTPAPPVQPVAFGAPEAAAPAGAPAGGPPAAQPATCPRCGGHALPLCDRCSSIMLPAGGGLFYCPHCGSVGTPLCPYCNARMVPPDAAPAPLAAAAPAGSAGVSAGGQFFCPRCNTTGLPNWSATGAPACPSCGGTMSLRGGGL